MVAIVYFFFVGLVKALRVTRLIIIKVEDSTNEDCVITTVVNLVSN